MKTVIIGAGIGGLCTAIALQKIGIEADIYEASPVIKPVGAGLGLAANAIKAFQKIGIANEVMEAGRFLATFSILDQQGRVITQTDSLAVSQRYGLDNFTIHRADLHRILLNHLDSRRIFTNKRAVSIEQLGSQTSILFQDGTTCLADRLIVADGIHSPIRQQLRPDAKPRYAGYTCWRAVVDNSQLNIQEATETWGTAGRIGFVPLANNQLYWFACVNAPQQDARLKQFSVKDLQHHFRGYHHPVAAVLEQTRNEQLLHNDIIDLAPLSQYAYGTILLLGDAAHATTPNMGQGACQAIEDAAVLADELRNEANTAVAFKRFEQRRLDRTHFIVNQSRRIGQVAQLENRFLASLRNGLMRLLPPKVNEQQLEKLYTVDF
ncbi:FAD-dependent monooxygenase [Tellurirhabdus bombi]|uniref:FAD-dependent monooxygenase n=1 Tax=Tellurirhabdus bombi TaxID=2907205 RepID=UPI001F40B146|nr:FAD-dependent monooxygenase [Tellurirhabdus bombi]